MTNPSNSDMAAMMRDLRDLLSLVAEIRAATNGNRLTQAELVAHCADLAKRAAVLEKVRAYPYIPTGIISIIERELRTNTTTP